MKFSYRYISTLEQQGLFIPQLASFIKGTVQCVADNLGAHGLAGFVEFLREVFVDFVQLSLVTFRRK